MKAKVVEAPESFLQSPSNFSALSYELFVQESRAGVENKEEAWDQGDNTPATPWDQPDPAAASQHPARKVAAQNLHITGLRRRGFLVPAFSATKYYPTNTRPRSHCPALLTTAAFPGPALPAATATAGGNLV